MIFIRKEIENDRKRLFIGPFRISYRTVITDQMREMFIGPFHFRYWIDPDKGNGYFRIFGLKFPYKTNTSSKKWLHYNMRDELTTERCKQLLQEELAPLLGYTPNLDAPKTYNEKILWMKLYERNPLIRICCDKYAVKQYVSDLLGPELVLPVLGSWDDPAEIDFDQLPDRFVLKVNWSSGYNIIVRDKSELSIPETVAQLKEWMQPHKNSYYDAFNWGYKDIKPVAYAEPYIEQIDGQVYDYKFCMSNGELLYTLIATDRNAGLTKDYFDREFNHLPVFSGGSPHAKPLPAKPKNYDRMLEISKELSKPFLFVRVDFYEIGDTIYLGEMTFYPGGGKLPMTPKEWEYTFGEQMHLPKIPNVYEELVER